MKKIFPWLAISLAVPSAKEKAIGAFVAGYLLICTMPLLKPFHLHIVTVIKAHSNTKTMRISKQLLMFLLYRFVWSQHFSNSSHL